MAKSPSHHGAPKTRSPSAPRPTATRSSLSKAAKPNLTARSPTAPAQASQKTARIKLDAAPKTRSVSSKAGLAISPRAATEEDQALLAGRLDLPSRKIPDDVRASLLGRSFNSWGAFRRAVNKAWSQSPTVKNDPFFDKENIARMKAGLNPLSPQAGRVGRRASMEMDHLIERRDGGAVYDAKNLTVRTPLSHIKKLKRRFDLASGAQKICRASPSGKPKI
jgi:hypothetical protein